MLYLGCFEQRAAITEGVALAAIFAAKLCFFCDSNLPDFVSALSNGLTGREDKAW
jgi:hypothetical protein